MNTDDKLKTAARLIATNIREGELLADEPYGWGLTLADVAKDVFAREAD